MFSEHDASFPVIQFPLFTGAGREAGFTQEPGAQLLFIKAGEYVNPMGLGGLFVNHGETCHNGSNDPITPCPVESETGFGNCWLKPRFKQKIHATIKVMRFLIRTNLLQNQ